ncbi:MAG: TIGR03960 family B12-binding radical SAM protein [Candidatus Electryonea clarkiae]|nr:TIGR03960 family B12-binding radical SAM protein [Candidatus Electryonea clarkiae]
MNDNSRFQELILPYIRKPNRYTGLEFNVIKKINPTIRWALGFPDLYEIGMSNLGLSILYHQINSKVMDVAAERVFLPDEYTASLLRNNNILLHTLESGTALADVDIIGISIGYEMAMPGILELLDLGGVPVYSRDRKASDPIVIAGGPVMYNPEPVADFFDAIVIGDGEDVVIEISNVLLNAKRNGLARQEIIARLGNIAGIYVPTNYDLVEDEKGFIYPKLSPDDQNMIIRGRIVENLKPEYYPDKPLVPLVEIVHDRLNIEVMRGCTRGCRFCNAGMIYRPVRERPADEVISQAIKNIAETGFNELGLTSLSTSDYSYLPEVMRGLQDEFRGKGVSLSFPSLRPDSFTPEMAAAFPEGRKGGITFAPEAGTDRLRDVINKNTSVDALLNASALAYKEGWSGIKLYFMIGLPTETEEDIKGIVTLAFKVAKLRLNGRQKLTVSASPFVPKAHTPFQWFGQEPAETLHEKIKHLRKKFQNSPVRFIYHNPEKSLYEGVLARGDRQLSKIIYRIWKLGGVLESWSDKFSLERWEEAFNNEKINPFDYIKPRNMDENLPWHHITNGTEKKFNLREWNRSQEIKTTDDCRFGKCYACGLSDMIPEGEKVCNRYQSSKDLKEISETPEIINVVNCIGRIRYERGAELQWTGHLDIVNLWDRLLRRTNLPIAYSQGFTPHPKISFAPPLPLGLISQDEYIDICLTERLEADTLLESLRNASPIGLEPIEAVIFEKSPSPLTGTIDKIIYEFTIDDSDKYCEGITKWFELNDYFVQRIKKKKMRKVNIRPFVECFQLTGDNHWKLILLLKDGATARLDEIATAFNFPEATFTGGVRTKMLIQSADQLFDPIDAATIDQQPISRSL